MPPEVTTVVDGRPRALGILSVVAEASEEGAAAVVFARVPSLRKFSRFPTDRVLMSPSADSDVLRLANALGLAAGAVAVAVAVAVVETLVDAEVGGGAEAKSEKSNGPPETTLVPMLTGVPLPVAGAVGGVTMHVGVLA